MGSRPRRPGDRAPHPRRSVRRTPVRRTYKPSADDRSHRRVGSTRYESPREMVRLATGGPTTDPLLAKGGYNQRGWRESLVRASTRQRGDEGALREGCVRRPASQGVGSVDGSNNCVFEVQQLAPLRGKGGQGQGDAGCRLEGGTGKTLGWRGRKRQRRPGWRLAHAGSHETLAELGCRPTVMCGVL